MSLYVWQLTSRKKDGASKNRTWKWLLQGEGVTDADMIAKFDDYLPKEPWRIYRSINPRNVVTAKKLLVKKLIDTLDDNQFSVESAWISSLMKSPADRNILLDIDSKDPKVLIYVLAFYPDAELTATSNGYHAVVRPPLEIQETEEITIKRDCFTLIEWGNGAGD